MTSLTRTLAGLFAVLVPAVSCSGSDGGYEAACDKGCECADCSDVGLQDCYDNGKAAYEHAVEKGCEEEAQETSACDAEHTVCEGGFPVLDEENACDEARVALTNCLGS